MNYKDDVHPDDDNEVVANKLLNAHMSGDIVIVVGSCTVNYEGRAWKYLEEGKRSVVINPSGAVLVHDANNIKPANWQPKDAETSIDFDEDEDVIITSERTSPDEELQIRFTDVYKSIHYNPSDDYGEVEGTEDEMHQYIIENPSFIEEDFEVIEHEKETEFGFIDIFGIDKDKNETVIEVKRKKATMDAVDQLERYMETVNGVNKRGILVAPSANESTVSLLEKKGYEFIEMEPTVITQDND